VEWSHLRRGALFGTILLPDSRHVDVLTLHNAATFEAVSGGCGAECRGNALGARQMQEALSWFQTLSPAPGGIFANGEERCGAPALRVFCGDFNLDKDTASFKHTASRARETLNLFDVLPASEPTFGAVNVDGSPAEWLLTFPADRGTRRVVDHIFADRLPIEARVTPMANEHEHTRHVFQQVSDHNGVEAVFEI